MPPAPRGELRTYRRSDGTTTFTLRFRALGRRWNIRLGTEEDGWTEARASKELAKQLALVEAGVWTPPSDDRQQQHAQQTIHVLATEWLEGKELDLKPNSVADLRWRLECHLLPFFAGFLADQVDDAAVADYKLHKQRERKQIETSVKAGRPPRDARNQTIRPLSNVAVAQIAKGGSAAAGSSGRSWRFGEGLLGGGLSHAAAGAI